MRGISPLGQNFSSFKASSVILIELFFKVSGVCMARVSLGPSEITIRCRVYCSGQNTLYLSRVEHIRRFTTGSLIKGDEAKKKGKRRRERQTDRQMNR